MKQAKFIAIFLTICSVYSCSNERNDPVRKSIDNLSEVNKSQKSIIASPLISAIDDVNTPSACARLNEISDIKNQSHPAIYSYFASLTMARSREWVGRIDVEQSPFMQLFLGEKFALGTTEEFYKKAKEEYEAGNISYTKWMIVKLAYETGIGIEGLHISATNSKLEEAFPGIFGTAAPATTAIYWKLASKLLGANPNPVELRDTLTKKMPLFPGDGSWDSLADSSRVTIASAAKTFRGNSSDKEKICAMILLNQNFAQLLRLKGYHAPVSIVNGKKESKVNELTSSRKEFPKKNVTGAFINVKTGKSIVLENENISSYDPAKGLLAVTSVVPNGEVSSKLGNVNDALAFMETLVYAFEGTSPVGATALKNNGEYLLGDILTNPKAVLPAEAHSLALGLLTMNFKNLAGLHLKKFDYTGAEATNEDLQSGKKIAAGILLTHGALARGVVEIRLDDAIRFARVTSYLENGLGYFLKEKSAAIYMLNPVYTVETQISLFGKLQFNEAKLEQAKLDLADFEKNNSAKLRDLEKECKAGVANKCVEWKKLKDTHELLKLEVEFQEKGNAFLRANPQFLSLMENLQLLRFPVAVLLSQLGTSPLGCAANLDWDLTTGEKRVVSACSKAQKMELADMFELMGRASNSQLLLKKAQKLREEN